MEFQKQVYECMQLCAEEIKNEEQTLELRVPEAMPDVGNVLGAWGQVLIRSKEWKDGGMGITGGVMAWVMYAPEDGSMPRVVEGWIPFSMRWDLPQTDRDGRILTSCLLRSVDGRCLSARKLMVRANLSVLARAYTPSQFCVYSPGNVPQDVQLLRRSYPVCFPAEAGEKQFQLDEDLTVPSDMAGGKLIAFRMQPEIVDRKLMADKVVFRGMALVSALLRSQEGQVKSCSFDVPFSQYAQLDREYGSGAAVQVLPIATSMEMDLLEDGKLRLKAGLAGQYVIFDRPLIELVEDAYSNVRDVKLQTDTVQLPVILETLEKTVSVSQTAAAAMDGLLDVSMYLQQPAVQRGVEELRVSLNGGFQVLGKNETGALTGVSAKWEEGFAFPADRNTELLAVCCPTGRAQGVLTSEETVLKADVKVDLTAVSTHGLPQLAGLELGELREPDPQRPTVVLRRAEGAELWQLAKETGSTVDAIRRVNRLQEEPAPGQMLLIPVI